jgi:cytochrome P450
MVEGQPAAMSACRADPTLTGFAVHEALRCGARFTFGLPGVVDEDAWFGGRLLQAGTVVVPNFHGAESDPARTPDPATFRLDRRPRAILAWGAGPYARLGRHFARVALEEFAAALIALRPQLASVPLRWQPGTMPVPAALPVRPA